jgi:hypothetical protein
MNSWMILTWELAAMPLDLNVPPIISKQPKRRKYVTRLIEAVLMLGITFLGTLAMTLLLMRHA